MHVIGEILLVVIGVRAVFWVLGGIINLFGPHPLSMAEIAAMRKRDHEIRYGKMPDWWPTDNDY